MDKIVSMQNNSKPLVSIITVVYNAASTIEATILSVINQGYRNIEYIIIDGGSTDGTLDIINKYNDKISNWISEPDKGIYDAMNKGVRSANGDYIYFIGADDVLLANISDLINFFSKNIIIYGNVIYKSTGKVYNGKFSTFDLITKNIPHQAIFYPKSVFKKYDFQRRYTLFADYYLNLKCWNDSEFGFLFININVALYNDTGLSSQNKDKDFLKNQFSIFMHLMPWYYKPFIFFRKFHSLFLKYHIIS